MRQLLLAAGLLLISANVLADDYVIDTQGAHASINFKINHLGYSWLKGRFNDFSGTYSYDPESPQDASISVVINTQSLDSNHAERDKHLKSDDFLNVSEYPEAKFVSSKMETKGDNVTVTGDFTLHGVTKSVVIDAKKIGEGKDPWGGYRTGFMGTTEFALKDFGIDYDLGPASQTVYLELHIEGVKK